MIMDHKLECTGCSNFCVMDENGEITHLEGNCCHRGIISAKRQLGIIDKEKEPRS